MRGNVWGQVHYNYTLKLNANSRNLDHSHAFNCLWWTYLPRQGTRDWESFVIKVLPFQVVRMWDKHIAADTHKIEVLKYHNFEFMVVSGLWLIGLIWNLYCSIRGTSANKRKFKAIEHSWCFHLQLNPHPPIRDPYTSHSMYEKE